MSDRNLEIFNSHFASAYARLANPHLRFIHYTSPEAALNIIKSQKFWMRNTTVMNDASEVYHGTRLVHEYFGSERGAPFFDCLDRIEDGLSNRVKQMYDAWTRDLETNTYVSCLSEHDISDFPSGRLSMWRAYGANGGVGLVLNPYFSTLETDHLQTYSYPVLYMDDQKAFREFDDFSKRIVLNESFLKSLSPDEVFNWCFHTLQNFGLCLKNPAFAEELEWRVVHRPNANPSEHVKSITCAINGTPQVVYQLPINEEPRDDNNQITIDRILDHVVIGPCDSPEVVAKAIISELGKLLGPDRLGTMIKFSNIPLRRSS